ncbi:MAG: dinitrogenase iron-molybdenum cofactor biosynthesis protein [Prolixibacteraceae bacterium]|nr:dinitrogenase iron-molybdenum cofactor biosynthesis protein [Prolixibacteraceae bacterium]
MKIVITSKGNTPDSIMDTRFGRAQWFCLFNTENGETVFHQNPNIEAMGGAGTKTAEMMVELGAEKIISGHFGPKAKSLLEKFNIQLIEVDKEEAIQTVIDKLN